MRHGLLAGLIIAGASGRAQPFHLPTANRALFEPGGEERFYAGTVGKPWTSGTFGCVRTEGRQMHEGLDIRSLIHDKEGEPADPVLAAAEGTVAYVNRRPSLSNYGIYLVFCHRIEGLEIYSLYAHLSEVRPGLAPGQLVRAGERIATLGRTTNTRERIGKDRAHVHFELNLLVNERFAEWHKKHQVGQRNDHGAWNGQNFLGLDPRELLLAQQQLGPRFSLVQYLRSQTELCRVLVRSTDFHWLRRYPVLLNPNPTAAREGVVGYELSLNFNGIPFQVTPRASSEIKERRRVQLVSVNNAEFQRRPCRKLVVRKGSRWELAHNGENLISLLTF